MNQQEPAALVRIACPDTAAAVAATLRDDGWHVRTDQQPGEHGAAIGCVVFDPGFVCYADHDHRLTGQNPAAGLDQLVTDLLPALAGRDRGGAAVISFTTREALGSPADIRKGAAAASVVAAVRGLALAHAARGISVNAVCALERPPAQPPGPVRGLLPDPVTLADVAAATAFFAGHRSRYITGQTLYVCAGTSLLSSLSA
jgi:NAD(P)-dependent dehydrogenase (short-subunit alcohol dehydrogenase family)